MDTSQGLHCILYNALTPHLGVQSSPSSGPTYLCMLTLNTSSSLLPVAEPQQPIHYLPPNSHLMALLIAVKVLKSLLPIDPYSFKTCYERSKSVSY